MKSSRLFLIAAACLLLSAMGLVVYGSTRIPAPRFTGQLQNILPPAPPGWTMKKKPIADSQEMQEAVGELLNFDDGVFVDYLSPSGDRLSVYIAYWTPGKMSHRLVAGHTPDVCWAGGGWQKTAASTLPASKIGHVAIPIGENRIFSAQGTPEYVWFWHLVGSKSKSYGTGTTAPWHAAITDLLANGLNQREEQFFIRLSSNKPLESLMDKRVLPTVLTHLPWPVHPSGA